MFSFYKKIGFKYKKKSKKRNSKDNSYREVNLNEFPKVYELPENDRAK